MKPEIKKQWVAALRSGEYDQTRDTLKDDGGFCCLGVLCDIHSKTQGVDLWNDAMYDDAEGDLPSSVMAWADLDDGTAKVVIDGETALLAAHNDGTSGLRKKSFRQIADAIEAQL